MGRRLRRRPVARNGQMRERADSRTGPAAERNGRSSPPTSSSPMLGLSTQRRVHHRSAKRGKSARPFRVRRSRGLPREFLVTGTDTTSSVASSDTTAPFRSPPSQGSVLTPRRDRRHPLGREQPGPLDGALSHSRAPRERDDVQLHRRSGGRSRRGIEVNVSTVAVAHSARAGRRAPVVWAWSSESRRRPQAAAEG